MNCYNKNNTFMISDAFYKWKILWLVRDKWNIWSKPAWPLFAWYIFMVFLRQNCKICYRLLNITLQIDLHKIWYFYCSIKIARKWLIKIAWCLIKIAWCLQNRIFSKFLTGKIVFNISVSRYSSEMYQHANHWRKRGGTSSWQFYEAGKFAECVKPGHQSCLDQFVADGSLRFNQNLLRGWHNQLNNLDLHMRFLSVK